VAYRQVMDWIIAFIDTRNYGKFSATAISAHLTVHRHTCTSVLGLHWPYPDNGFITVLLSLQITHEVFFEPPNSFLAIIVQLPLPKDSSQFNSSAPKLISWHAGISKLDSTQLTSSL
jgi:hypothetical protein